MSPVFLSCSIDYSSFSPTHPSGVNSSILSNCTIIIQQGFLKLSPLMTCDNEATSFCSSSLATPLPIFNHLLDCVCVCVPAHVLLVILIRRWKLHTNSWWENWQNKMKSCWMGSLRKHIMWISRILRKGQEEKKSKRLRKLGCRIWNRARNANEAE